jgi:hypothetical protein
MLHGRHDRKIEPGDLESQGQAYAIRTRSAKQLPTPRQRLAIGRLVAALDRTHVEM